MRVLVACEFSGTVRDAFASKGHDAWSCDLLPTEKPRGNHIVGNCLAVLKDGWDLMICHPPCTHLASSGAKWFDEKRKDGRQRRALEFVLALLKAPIPRICLENPVGVITSNICKPSQIIHPWQFGHAENKATCLWLKNLPRLRATKIVPKKERKDTLHRLSLSPNRWKIRSKTFQGIADAMADQWPDDRRLGFFGVTSYEYRLKGV